MAGWSNLEGSSCIKQCNETKNLQELKLERYFVELVSGFLKDSSGNECFRPLPPRLGNGHCIDLLKLYFVVKQKGGFGAISKQKLWGEVSVKCGLDSSLGSAFKLIYAKYLSPLESGLVKLVQEKSSGSNLLMELERIYRVYASKVMDVKRGSDSSGSSKLEKSDISFLDLTDEDDENEKDKLGWKKLAMDFVDSEGSNEGNDDSVKLTHHNIAMCSLDDGKSTGKSTGKSKQLKDGMSFADVGDSTEGNGESVDLKQQGIAMNSVKGKGINEGDNAGENFRSEMSFVDGIFLARSDKRRLSASSIEVDNVVKSSENSSASKKCWTKYNEKAMMNVDSNHKRKRDCLSRMLRWMANAAKDPTDPVIGEIPGSSRWSSYGNDNSWKQVLLSREALFLKKTRVRSAEQFGCQKKPKMHPLLFDHYEKLSTINSYPSEASQTRPRQRLEARLDMQPTASIYSCRPQQRIPTGKGFQVQVPEWTGVAVESDSKWLGTLTWPMEKSENQWEPLGKGRTDSCGCQFPGSTVCVMFHVSERRMMVRSELGSAFYAWKFDKMGEDCSVSWTVDEEKKFRSIVKENPQSSGNCFWEPMCKALPKKKWADQVSYYYNVFMLRRRGYQNRHYPADIDSGDDETEYRSTNNSIKHGSA